MTVFQTPGPISVSLEFGVGDLRLVAGDGPETVVEVRPTDPSSRADINAAEQTRVDYASGSLLVRGSRSWRRWTPRGGRESIDVEIRLPQGSQVSAEVGVATVHGAGRLGDIDIRTGMGNVRVEAAGAARIRTGFGDVWVERISGDVEVSTGSGRIELGSVTGSATVKNSNGETRIGHVAGRAQIRQANGAISVDDAGSHVAARTALGDIRLGVVSHGGVEARTSCGRIDIGVRDGVAAWLELSTGFGRVDNDLDDMAGPPEQGETLEVRAHSAAGDINIRRVVLEAGTQLGPGRVG